MDTLKKTLPFCLLLVMANIFQLRAELRFEGVVPAGVNRQALAVEYSRIYRTVAPLQRPDRSVLRIVYFSKTDKIENAGILPEWGGGGAIGGNLIIIPTDFKPFLEQNFSQVTVHEIVHSVLYRAYPGVNIPRWFHEGLAMLMSGELSFEESSVLSKAIFLSRLMPLASIDSVNGFGRNRADLAYSQSHCALRFLTDNYSMEVIADILRKAQRMHDFWKGLNEAVGLSPAEFEDLTRKYIVSKYQFVFLITDYYAWWVGIALLVIVGFFVTMRRNRKRAEAMDEAERREIAAAAEASIEKSEPEKNAPP